MKSITKKTIIRITSIISALLSATIAYLFATGTIQYEPMQVEGVPAISLNVQITLLCILTGINYYKYHTTTIWRNDTNYRKYSHTSIIIYRNKR